MPSDTEWETLVNYLGGDAVAGGAMKEAGTAHWSSPNTGATNSSGFTGLPGGYRYTGNFASMSYYARFWSSTEASPNFARDRYLLHNSAQIGRGSSNELYGFSIRCIKD